MVLDIYFKAVDTKTNFVFFSTYISLRKAYSKYFHMEGIILKKRIHSNHLIYRKFRSDPTKKSFEQKQFRPR